VILGALLFVSPWLLSRSFASARADAFAGGALLVLVSLLAIAAFREWEERINLAIGCWILASPFLLHFAVTSQPSFSAIINSSLLAKILFDSLPLLFLGVTFAVTLAVLVRGIMRFATRRAAPAAPVADPATSSSAPTQRIGDRDVLDKVNSASRR